MKIVKNRFSFISRLLAIGCLIACLQVTSIPPVQAQCPMCKMTAESNLKGGGSAGKGLNSGILLSLIHI